MLERTRSGSPFQSELLLAPIGSRETDADPTYCWVQSQLKLQTDEERKRLFYVACTRARTRLHLFATLKVSRGKASKAAKGSLLGATGLAFTAEIDQRAASFVSGANDLPSAGLALAASAELPPTGHSILERLPSGWGKHSNAENEISSSPGAIRTHRTPKPLFTRNSSASLLARARGNAVHTVLERLAHLFAAETSANVIHWQQILKQSAERTLRSGGFTDRTLHSAAAEVARTGMTVATSDIGQWLLAPHPGALAESTWQTWDEDGNLRTLRVDRSFRAGPTPAETGDRYLWLIDYKTGASAPQGEVAKHDWREQQKQQWRGQLEAYGAVLQQANEQNVADLRYGLFFPELLELITWN
jgi:ATP-dependent helicase/nuclease subunit A